MTGLVTRTGQVGPAPFASLPGRFDGYGVVVTGGARGIGEATARRFAAEGAAVLIADIHDESAEATAASIRAAGGRALAAACDVADRATVDAAIGQAADAFGTLDVLVNNAYACSYHQEDFAAESDEDWYRDLDVSLVGAMRCARAALPHLRAAPGRRGAIVNIGSVNGLSYFGNHAYSAAKAGLVSLTRSLAVRGASDGVRCNLVVPGTVRTPAWSGREAQVDAVARAYPLDRVGEAVDIAAAITFLASRDAAWITGATLPVDGGVLVANPAFTDLLAEAGE